MISTQEENKNDRVRAEKKWNDLLGEAKKMKPGMEEPNIPYKEDHLVGLFNGLDNANAVIPE